MTQFWIIGMREPLKLLITSNLWM